MTDKFPVTVESRTVEANGWVEAGTHYSAMFVPAPPEGVRGCPLGRSQASAEAAVLDLITRTNDESRTSITREQITIVR